VKISPTLSAASYPPLQKTQGRGTHSVVVSAQPKSGLNGPPVGYLISRVVFLPPFPISSLGDRTFTFLIAVFLAGSH
jgi:hypothetical protein